MSPAAFDAPSSVPPPQSSAYHGSVPSSLPSSFEVHTTVTAVPQTLPEGNGVSYSLSDPTLPYHPNKANARLERDVILNGTAHSAIYNNGLNGITETATHNGGATPDGPVDTAIYNNGASLNGTAETASYNNGATHDGLAKTTVHHNGATLNGTADTAIHNNHSTWSMTKEKIVLGPYDYLENQPGKDIRKQLITAFNACLQVPKESLEVITKAIAMLHTASLLIDDVEDGSFLRRGNPVAHSIFGTAQTINSANYVYFTALQELLKLHNPEAIEIYTRELSNLHRGQGMDLFWRDTLTCPTEHDYLEMVSNKTGGLFRLAIQLMQVESRSEQNYIPLVNTIGLLFQIRDDYMNLHSTEYTSNKGLCEDLTEGKFSFPIIHSIRSNPSNQQLLNILKQKPNDDDVKRYALKYMESTGSFEYCRKVLRELKGKAMDMIDELDRGTNAGSGIRIILDKMDV